MSVAIGTRLGPYEVLDLLGVGGMGEVYRARDARLGREVALKLVRVDGARGPDRLKRFETEARAVARLSHPNVLSVHDVGTHEGVPYLVLELLQGETLRQRLCRGPLAGSEAAELALQACAGLHAAHARGIVHRDLKPENLFLTSDGLVKILDFGIAKLQPGDGAGAMAETQTEDGVLLGTTGYLSPEQARGAEADARSDVFALGVVLYEALSGRRAFARQSAAETLVAILNDDPPPLETGPGPLPVALERIVRRCLEKDPQRRFQSAHDLALALEAVTAQDVAPRLAQPLAEEPQAPYPGLRSFTEAEAPRFFGRESEVAALWAKLGRRRLLALIGPSGAGKTSFVRAGVIPERPRGWAVVVSTPGTSPFLMLAQSLAAELAGDAEAVRQLLRFEEADCAVASVARWRRAHAGALLVVDQLEELFTQNPPELQARFASLLGRLAAEADVRVLLSLRDDFLMRCHEHEALAPVFEELTPLGVLAGDALRRALVEPARAAGYRFEDEGLVERMLGSVRGERGALPLLAFAAWRLWEQRDRERRLLTRASYEEIGGVSGALAQHAEAVLQRIGGERQGIVRELFRNLVTSQGTRAAADREELLSVCADRTVAEEVLSELIDARLLTSYELPAQEARAGGHRVEVVHESLLAAWPRLVRWQAQDAEGALLRDQLRQAAHRWQEKGRPADLLWSGTPLREYELWRERYPGRLTAVEEDFARAMRVKALRRKRGLRIVAAAVLLTALGVAGAIGISRHQAVLARERAEREARKALASRLLALGELEIVRYPTAALAFTTRSLEIEDTPEARRQALRILWMAPPARVVRVPEGVTALNLAFDHDGRTLAGSGFYPPSVVLFGEDGRHLRTLTKEGEKTRPRVPGVTFGGDAVFRWTWGDEALAWTLDGHPFVPFDGPVWQVMPSGAGVATIGPSASGSASRLLKRWSVGGGVTRLLRTVPLPEGEWPDPALTRLFRPTGPSLFVRPFPRGRALPPAEVVGRHDAPLVRWALPPGGDRTLSIDSSGEWRVWSTTDHLLLARRRAPPIHAYSDAVFDRDGSRIAWSSGDGPTHVWQLADPPDAEPLKLLSDGGALAAEGGGDMGIPAFHPGGRWLASSLGYRTLSLWPVGLPHARSLPGLTQGTWILRFSADSRYLLSCSREGMKIWPLGLGEGTLRKVELGGPHLCYGADSSVRGEAALASVGQGLVIVTPSTGTVRRLLPREEGFFEDASFEPSGRRVATNLVRTEDTVHHVIRVADTETGATQDLEYTDPGPTPHEAVPLAFVRDGRLLLGGNGGVFAWRLGEKAPVPLLDLPGAFASIRRTPDGRWLTVTAVEGPTAGTVIILDLESGTRRSVTSHGFDVGAALLDATGRILVSADSKGLVRVGPVTGEPPHLLPGHTARVAALAVSPDGRWIASAAGTDVRLWPMPDLAKPPLHSLPVDTLLSKLHALTNLRVIEDESAANGYRVEVGPFPGWKDVPSW